MLARLSVRLPAITVTACVASMISASPAVAATSTTSAFVHDTNRARVNHDRQPYRVRDGLHDTAQQWAEWMARHHTLRHNPYLSSQVHNWRDLGENVGTGGSESAIQRAFMGSPDHRSNILSRSYTQVGIGTARDNRGVLYVDEIFKRPM